MPDLDTRVRSMCRQHVFNEQSITGSELEGALENGALMGRSMVKAQ